MQCGHFLVERIPFGYRVMYEDRNIAVVDKSDLIKLIIYSEKVQVL